MTCQQMRYNFKKLQYIYWIKVSEKETVDEMKNIFFA